MGLLYIHSKLPKLNIRGTGTDLPDLVETLLFEVMMNGYGDQACDTLHI